MKTFIKFDGLGNLTGLVRPPEGVDPPEGFIEVDASEHVSVMNHWWDGEKLVPYTAEVVSRRRLPPWGKFTWIPAEGRWQDDRPLETRLEEEWKDVRAKRDKLLRETDWRVLRAFDMGVPLPAEWVAYRQALRDVTNQSDPFKITWPSVPS